MSQDRMSDAPPEKRRAKRLTPEQATEMARLEDERARRSKARKAVRVAQESPSQLQPWMTDRTLLPKRPPGRTT